MFGSTINSMPRCFRNRTASLSCVVFLFISLSAGVLSAQSVASYGFEDGTFDGWSSFNGSNYGNNIPPAVLAEQGWLYAQYFTALRQLSGKLSAVTFWGKADDDTWLDGFPVARTDYPLLFDMGLQAKPAYWGIVDPTQLPGYGMTFTASTVPGERDTRTVTITATNGNVGPAYTTQINGFALTQISGPSCSPTITASGRYSIVLGDIPTSGSASAAFTVSIVGCNPNSQFTLSVPWSSAVYDTGTFTTTLDFKRGNGR